MMQRHKNNSERALFHKTIKDKHSKQLMQKFETLGSKFYHYYHFMGTANNKWTYINQIQVCIKCESLRDFLMISTIDFKLYMNF